MNGVSGFNGTTGVLAIGGTVVVMLVLTVLSIIAWVRILNKAGYSGWWILVSFVPVINLIMFFVFAFVDWPVCRQLRQHR
ncbi:MAG: hypothetical protein M0Z27_06800 [Thermaerobacter sp.]|jgi:uncharacterized membrane protein YhaH (DUF805 family)|nr:hypothetical protein [Thermaerobacter sp.]MDA8145752.1 hypothetical protein [Thermaerobacter sp.]